MRRFGGSLLAVVLSSAAWIGAPPAHADAPRTLVRESFVDYPREHPGGAAKVPGAGGARSCGLPASDLCTDFKDARLRWANPSVSYRVNTAGAPSGALNAIRAAFAAWQNETKSSAVAAVYGPDASTISYTYAGSSTAVGESADDQNVVSFADLSSSCSGCLAVTTYWYSLGTRNLAEFDITINTEYPWATTGAADAYDVQDVVTHEAGHSLVLGDLYRSPDAALTMYGYAGLGEVSKRDLGAGDVLGVRKAYP